MSTSARAALSRQIGRTGVAERDRGVSLQQQHGRWFPNDQTASHHHRPLAGQLIAVVIQDLQAGLCSTGGKAAAAASKHSGQGTGGDPVYILGRGERGTDGGFVQMPGQRAKQQTTMDRGVLVDRFDDVQRSVSSTVSGRINALQ